MSKKEILRNEYQIVTSENKDTFQKLHIQSNDGVVIAIQYSNGYFLVNHNRQFKNSLEFVRGYMETNETPTHAALREIREELNVLPIDISDIISYGTANPDNELFTQTINFILVNLKTKPKFKLQSNEGIYSVVWLSKNDLQKKVKQNEVTDMFTLSFLAKLPKII